MNIYYVYVYLDTRKAGSYVYGDYIFDFEPIYVGKGKGSRSIRHLKTDRNNAIKTNKIDKIIREGFEPKIVKVVEGVSNDKALSIEIDLIKLIGRYCKGEGPLTNVKPGGEDPIGYKHTNDYIEQLHKPVVKYNLSGKVLEEYLSVQEAGFKNKTHPQTISQICGGGIKIWKNKFIFMYKGEKFVKRERDTCGIPVIRIDYDNVVTKYKSATEAALLNNTGVSKISEVCIGNKLHTGGFLFRYENVDKYDSKINDNFGKYLKILYKPIEYKGVCYKNVLQALCLSQKNRINNLYNKFINI